MLTYNLVGTYKGRHMLCTRPVNGIAQNVTFVQRLRAMTVFASNGVDCSYTQMLEIINENKEGDVACTQTDNVVWSPKGSLMRTQDPRLHFLRFTQRDSIVFAAIESPERRSLVEVFLSANKFASRVSMETDICQPLEADACGKYLWVVTTTNCIEVHNWHDKDSRSLRMPDGFTAKSVMCIGTDGMSAVVLAENNAKHYSVLTMVQLINTDLVMAELKPVGKTTLQLQPGTLVQCKGCMIFTLKHADQRQYLVAVANYKDKVFYNMTAVRSETMGNGVPIQRVLFTDAVVTDSEIHIAVVVNRNNFSMWSVNMDLEDTKYEAIGSFGDDLPDLILDRVILMHQDQNKLEERGYGTLLSADITDAVVARMRHQVEISTATARAMVDSSRAAQNAGPAVSLKDMLTLRDASETTRKRLQSDHERAMREKTAAYNAKVLELEQRISDLTAARDARVTIKQHDQLKAMYEKLKADYRGLEQSMQNQQSASATIRLKLDADVIALQQRVATVQAAREQLQHEYDTLKDEQRTVLKIIDTLKATNAAKTADATKATDAVQVAEKKYTELLRAKQALQQVFDTTVRTHAEEKLILEAQLAEARSRTCDETVQQQLRQLTLQHEASQNRSRIQYETLQREIDSLRRANYTLSQSYTMLQTVTKFNFLPDGTSLDTAMHMMRNLTVFQQDLATARDEASTLRKKVQELEARV